MSYIEGVQIYRIGGIHRGGQIVTPDGHRSGSNRLFRDSMNRIFPNTYNERKLRQLYSDVRCGMFHAGMVNQPVIISAEFIHSIEFLENSDIHINHRMFLSDLRMDFQNYINQLKNEDNEELRGNFNRCFSNV
jgi:hypothetical protein